MKKFISEFKTFIMKNKVLDLAVGMIIGAALTAIVKSLVDDIISPIVGLLTKKDFSNLSVSIGEVNIKYGSFIMAVINFLITAFVIFLIIKSVNKMKDLHGNKKEECKTTKICPYCKSEININATKCPNCTSDIKDKE